MKMRLGRYNRPGPHAAFIVLWGVLVTLGFVVSRAYLPVIGLWHVLIAANAATFVLTGLDKFQAGRGTRVPERVFYLVSFLGGSVGMLLGMHAFRHKTRKVSFQFVLAVLILVQVLAVLRYAGLAF